MVFSSEFDTSGKRGETKVIPFKNHQMTMEQVIQAATALSEAEGEKDKGFIKGKKSQWCILLFLLNPALDENRKSEFIESWSQNYIPVITDKLRNHFKMESEKEAIFDTNGQLLIKWPKEANDLDFVLATQTQPRQTETDRSTYLAPGSIAAQFHARPEYFLKNRKHHITTPQDEEILTYLRAYDQSNFIKNGLAQKLSPEELAIVFPKLSGGI